MSELRWHPLLREWVITSTERQDRTFLPPKEHCPLDPTRPGGFPTEIPAPMENPPPTFARPPRPGPTTTRTRAGRTSLWWHAFG